MTSYPLRLTLAVLACLNYAGAATAADHAAGPATFAASGDVSDSPSQPEVRILTPDEMRAAKPMPMPSAKGPPPVPPGSDNTVAPPAQPGGTPGSAGQEPK